MIYYQTHN